MVRLHGVAWGTMGRPGVALPSEACYTQQLHKQLTAQWQLQPTILPYSRERQLA
jgi:hypothetical protein